MRLDGDRDDGEQAGAREAHVEAERHVDHDEGHGVEHGLDGRVAELLTGLGLGEQSIHERGLAGEVEGPSDGPPVLAGEDDLDLARELGLPRVVSVQNAYNLLNRGFEQTLAEVCFRENIGLLPYSVLAFGHLTGKYLADPAAPGRLSLFPVFGQRYDKPNVRPAVQAYADLAGELGMTPATLAQAFVAGRSFVNSTIVGATSVGQLEENLKACALRLPDDVIARIDGLHLQFTNPAP